MRRIFVLLCGVLLVGCGNTNVTEKVEQENITQESVQEENTVVDGEVEENIENEAPIIEDELGVMHIGTEGFVENMQLLEFMK